MIEEAVSVSVVGLAAGMAETVIMETSEKAQAANPSNKFRFMISPGCERAPGENDPEVPSLSGGLCS